MSVGLQRNMNAQNIHLLQNIRKVYSAWHKVYTITSLQPVESVSIDARSTTFLMLL